MYSYPEFHGHFPKCLFIRGLFLCMWAIKIHIYYSKLCVNVCLCEYVHMVQVSTAFRREQPKSTKFLGDGDRTDVNHLEWAIGPELRSSARGV